MTLSKTQIAIGALLIAVVAVRFAPTLKKVPGGKLVFGA